MNNNIIKDFEKIIDYSDKIRDILINIKSIEYDDDIKNLYILNLKILDIIYPILKYERKERNEKIRKDKI